jgi:hypothetical protein
VKEMRILILLLVAAAVANAAPKLKGQVSLQPSKLSLSEVAAKGAIKIQALKAAIAELPAVTPGGAGGTITPEFLPSHREIGEGLDSLKVDEEAKAAINSPPIPPAPCSEGCAQGGAEAVEEKKEEAEAEAAAEAEKPATTDSSSPAAEASTEETPAAADPANLEEEAGAHSEFQTSIGKAQAAMDESSLLPAPVEASPVAHDAEFQQGLASVDNLIARIKPHIDEANAPAAELAATPATPAATSAADATDSDDE